MSSKHDAASYQPSFRQQTVDKRLEDHDARITANEKRWLMTKGALATLAAIKGVDFALVQLGSFI
mgnify:CR=1 FL=1